MDNEKSYCRETRQTAGVMFRAWKVGVNAGLEREAETDGEAVNATPRSLDFVFGRGKPGDLPPTMLRPSETTSTEAASG